MRVWQFVLAGGDGVREDMPAERKADAKSKLPGAYIDGVDAFDAAFFGTLSLANLMPNFGVVMPHDTFSCFGKRPQKMFAFLV